MKPEYLQNIPEGWDVKRNGIIFKERIERGFENETLLSVSIANGVTTQEELDYKKDISNEDKSNYKKVCKGDLAYNKMRMWQGAIGFSEYEGIVSPAYVIISPILKCNSKYFHYLFRTPFYTNYSYQYSYGISLDQNSLRFSDFKVMYSPFPPKETQTQIANFLDEKTAAIEKIISARQKKLELLKELKAAIINEIMDNPKWEKKKVKFLATVKGRIGFRGYTTEYLVSESEGALTLGATHINNNGEIVLTSTVYISWDKYYESPEIMVQKVDRRR